MNWNVCVPKEFQGMNSILDKLVEMQHYNLPTRLLDVSSNALVALLFACQDFESDGEVIIFKEKRNKNPLAKWKKQIYGMDIVIVFLY